MDAALPHMPRVGADADVLAYGTPDHDDLFDPADSDDDDDIPRETAGDGTLPGYPYGVIFLHGLRVGPAYPSPRIDMRGLRFFSPSAFRYFFKADLDDVLLKFLSTAAVLPRNEHRIRNKVRKTPRHIEEPTDTNLFDLTSKGHRLPTPVRDEGSDMEEEEVVEEPNPILDEGLSKIWRQCFQDIVSKSPNQRGANNPSYCKLSKEEQKQVNEETYKDTRLSNFFHDCQWKIAEKGEWEANFQRFFPPRDKKLAGSTQNYLNMPYFLEWDDLKGKLADDTYEAVYSAMRARFHKLYWMPCARSDRVWWTKVGLTGFKKSSGCDETKPSPQVLINGHDPLW